ncbi:MAG TPA: NADP-dependent oxidoreductase [Actinomycetota bacterium]|nr:NADP-dependent oxidoreductase [Actinomycetota bacterium]
MRAAAVHPVDLAIRAGAFAELLPGRPRYVLGWDLAGTVDAVGEEVSAFRPGDAVVGLSVWLRSLAGTQAEFVVLDAAGVARAPNGAGWVEAATLPLNALAAIQALDLMPRGTRSVAIIGATGAVGGFAAELAAHRGQSVYAVTNAQDETFARGLSAVFVPRSADPAGAIRAAADGPVDAVLDTAGIDGAALGAVRDGGAFVTTLPPTAPPAERDIRVSALQVEADGHQLAELVALAEQGKLTLRVARTYPLQDAAPAHARLEKGGVRGRLVLTP